MRNNTTPTAWNLAILGKITYTFTLCLSNAFSCYLFQEYTGKIQNHVCTRLFVRVLFIKAKKTGYNTNVPQEGSS